jgi:hypothetical protein
MAELSQKDQLALHEFSVRYHAALAKQHQTPEQSLETVRDAVREQYEQEQDAKRDVTIEPPAPEKERKPDEPDQDR